MMFFNQEIKWKDWPNRGRGRGKEDENKRVG
jgi:hypothetical protein